MKAKVYLLQLSTNPNGDIELSLLLTHTKESSRQRLLDKLITAHKTRGTIEVQIR